MPIDTILNRPVLMNEESALSCDFELDESKRTNGKTVSTPAKHRQNSAAVTPDNSNASLSSSCSEGSLDEEDSIKRELKPVKTDHKLAELAGKHLPEPLLSENPGRFVLFPIQDNEVRRWNSRNRMMCMYVFGLVDLFDH